MVVGALVAVEAVAMSIPPKFELNINSLKLDESLTASDVELPDGVRLVTSAETIIVQCIERVEEEDEEEDAVGAEPEVIGRKAEDETED